MDKRSLHMLEFIASAPNRSYDEIEQFHGAPLDTSFEFDYLCRDNAICDVTAIVNPSDNVTRMAVTPHGREIIESYYRERRRDYISYATFVFVVLSFILKVLGYF